MDNGERKPKKRFFPFSIFHFQFLFNFLLDPIKKFIPRPLFDLYHYGLGFMGNLLYFFPSKNLTLIGITGTKGKTTVSYFLYQILEKVGKDAALSSTVFFAWGRDKQRNQLKIGMPGRFFLPRFLRKTLKKKIKYAIIETTSEGIAQFRHRFLDFNLAVYTGLSPEHIERHGGFSAYRKTKEKLFSSSKEIHVLNLNDRHVKHFLNYPAKEKWGIILSEKQNDFPEGLNQEEVHHLVEGVQLEGKRIIVKEWLIIGAGQRKLIFSRKQKIPFGGKFNIVNFLLAYASARSLGIKSEKIVKIINQMKLPPGRMEEIKKPQMPFRVFLDYAHEPMSLGSALEYIRSLVPKKNKLICLTGGQGGGRDVWKRKVMGAVAAGYCDYVVISVEDPYFEDPKEINNDILAGVLSNNKYKPNKNVWAFTNRRDAISKALNLANKNDIVILCGKGGEKGMCVKGKIIPWDEKRKVKRAINMMNRKSGFKSKILNPNIK